MALKRWFAVAVLLPSCASAGHAALFSRRSGAASGRRASAITLRKRLHVNTLITEPGTMEVEWGGAFDVNGSFSLPSALKYTPQGHRVFWGRTEFSASFDSLSSVVQFDDRITQFSDRVSLVANCVLFDGEKLDVAIAPQASFLLRGDEGARLGATAIARYDWGRNSAGGTVTWTGATAPSASNPSGTLDIGAGYGRRLMASGFLGHLTAHTNALYEKSAGLVRQVSVFEGMEYQITEKIALDISGQHFSVVGGAVDHQIAVGITANLGRLRKR